MFGNCAQQTYSQLHGGEQRIVPMQSLANIKELPPKRHIESNSNSNSGEAIAHAKNVTPLCTCNNPHPSSAGAQTRVTQLQRLPLS